MTTLLRRGEIAQRPPWTPAIPNPINVVNIADAVSCFRLLGVTRSSTAAIATPTSLVRNPIIETGFRDGGIRRISTGNGLFRTNRRYFPPTLLRSLLVTSALLVVVPVGLKTPNANARIRGLVDLSWLLYWRTGIMECGTKRMPWIGRGILTLTGLLVQRLSTLRL